MTAELVSLQPVKRNYDQDEDQDENTDWVNMIFPEPRNMYRHSPSPWRIRAFAVFVCCVIAIAIYALWYASADPHVAATFGIQRPATDSAATWGMRQQQPADKSGASTHSSTEPLVMGKAAPSDATGPIVVRFFAMKGCSHCKRFKPVWVRATSFVKLLNYTVAWLIPHLLNVLAFILVHRVLVSRKRSLQLSPENSRK
jgi:hypothetical protein